MSTPLRLLILEDSPADAELAISDLRRDGLDADWRRVDTEPAYLDALGPDLDAILADYHLPGFDMPRALDLASERAPGVPFIILSGAIPPEVAIECVRRGAADYVLKDRSERLPQAVRRALERRRLREENRQTRRVLAAREQEARRLAREQEALAEIGRIVSSSVDIEEVYERFASVVRALIPFDQITINTVDLDNGTFTSRHYRGPEIPQRPPNVALPLAGSLTEHVARTREGFLASSSEPEAAVVARFPGTGPAVATGVRSMLAVPLIARGKVLGTLHFRSVTEGTYSKEHLRLARQVADQIAGPMATASLHAEVERKAREEEALAEIGRVASSDTSLDDAFAQLAGLIAQLIPLERLSTDTVDLESRTFTIHHVWGTAVGNRTVGATTPLEGSMTGAVVEAGRALVIADADEEPDLAERLPGLAPGLAAGLKSFLSVPMVFRDRVFGVLHLRSSVANAFGPAYVQLAERVAAQIAGTVASAALREDMEHRARQEAALAEIGRIVTSSVEITEVYERFAEQVRSLLPADRISVCVVGRDAAAFTERYAWGIEVEERGSRLAVPLAGTMTGQIVATGRPVRWPADEPGARPTARWPGSAPVLAAGFRCGISVPLMAGGQPLGALHVSSVVPDAYREADVQLVERVAAQIAGAVAMADLREDLERRAREEGVLAEIGRVISLSPDIADVYSRFCEEALRLIPADHVSISSVSIDDDSVRVLYTHGTEIPERRVGAPLELTGAVLEEAARTGQTTIKDLRDEGVVATEMPAGLAGRDRGLLSVLSVPLLSGNTTIGVLQFWSELEEAYGLQSQRVGERVGAQIAGAVANAALREDVERQAREEAALAEIGRIVSSTLDLEEVFGRFTEQVRDLIPADTVALTAADHGAGTFTVIHRWGHEIPTGGRGTVMPLAGSLTGHVVATGRPLLWMDSRPGPEPGDHMPRLADIRRSGVRSILVAPLAFRDQPFGALQIWTLQPDAYTADHLALAERVAAQVAGAIAVAQAHATVARRAREDAALAEIGRIISSALDINEVYGQIAEQIVKLVPADRVVINSVDMEAATFTVRYEWGAHHVGRGAGATVPLAGSATGYVVSGAGALLVSDAEEDRDLGERLPGLAAPLAAGCRSFLSVPLAFQERFFGALHLMSQARGVYGPDELRLVERVAAQIAGAIAVAQAHAAFRTEAEARRVAAAAVETSLDGIAVMDAEGTLLAANPALARMLGRPLEGLAGESAFDLLLAGTAGRERRAVEVARRRGLGRFTGAFIETTIGGQDGARAPVELSLSAIGGEGEPRFVAILRDIADRVEARRALAESERRYRLMAEHARDIVYRLVLRPEPRFEYVSPSVERITGYPPEEYYADAGLMIRTAHPDDAANVATFFTDPESFDGSVSRRITRDGRTIWLEHRLAVEAGADGPFTVTGISRDVTERLEAEHALRESEASLREAQRIAGLGNWEWDIARGELRWSAEIYRMFEATLDEFPATREAFLQIVHPDDRERVREAGDRTVCEGAPYDVEFRVVLPRGTERVLHSRGELTVSESGEPTRLVGTIQDVTDRVATERALRAQGAALASALDAIIAADGDGNITFANRAAQVMFGATEEELIGTSVEALMPEEYRAAHRAGLTRLREGGDPRVMGDTVELEALGAKGRRIPVELSLAKVEGSPDAEFVASIRDITERKRTEAELRRLATTDALTGLFNRRQFGVMLDQALALARRQRSTGAVVALDIDRLKYVNDTYGHGAGDDLICAVAECLRREVRASDVVARMGGDEFALILHDASASDALRKAQDLVECLSRLRFDVHGDAVPVSCSVGVASFPGAGGSAEELVAGSDFALYRAKRAGGGRAECYDPSGEDRETFSDLRRAQRMLLDALDGDRIRLYWQPIFTVRERAPRMFEILARLEDREGVIHEPAEFIPQAEELNLIGRVDRRVIGLALERWRVYASAGRRLLLSVNLSGHSLTPEMAEFIIERATRLDVPPDFISLEITETTAIRGGTGHNALQRLSEAGFLLAMDDFGGGVTSLHQLRTAPFDYMKLDAVLVQNLATDSQDRELVAGLAALASTLRLTVIAEAVQDEESLAFLDQVGVRYAQGYYLGMPEPFPERPEGPAGD